MTGSLSPKSRSLASTWTTLAPWGGEERRIGRRGTESGREEGEGGKREKGGGRGREEHTHNGIHVYPYLHLVL